MAFVKECVFLFPLGSPAAESSPKLTIFFGCILRLVATGFALPYTAIAHPPTVTLPRLKALTTGSNPTFLDAILNIAEDDKVPILANVDSWVRQLALGSETGDRAPRKVVFVGDDTWLRLFPASWFEWSEGVTSFFVSVGSPRYASSVAIIS